LPGQLNTPIIGKKKLLQFDCQNPHASALRSHGLPSS
jgi:hypothetical protein